MTDNQGTSRGDDWRRFIKAILGVGEEDRSARPLFDWVLSILHTGKNVVVEEWRRWKL